MNPTTLLITREQFDTAWEEGSDEVNFDSTIVFGKGYDFEPLECLAVQACFERTSFLAWPDRFGPGKKWSLYSTHYGVMWFERFADLEAAKEAAYRELQSITIAKEPQ